jgi:PqqD family protein of HPr-rel-A system
MDDLPRMRWRVPPDCELLWERFEPEFVVFDPRSGCTHLLNEMAAAALKTLASRALDARELSELLAAEFRVSADEELLDRVAEMLDYLDAMGLVEPESCETWQTVGS